MFPRKLVPYLRTLRWYLFNVRAFVLMSARKLKRPSPKGTVAVLSLGGQRGSYYLARAVHALGYDLHVVSPDFPSYEGRYARGWTKADPISEFDLAKSELQAVAPRAVTLEYRNILVPIAARLNDELGLRSYGKLAPVTSNSKIAFRESLDAAAVPNLPWCRLEQWTESRVPFPFMVKPDKGTGSRGVAFVATKAEMSDAVAGIDGITDDPAVDGAEKVVEGFIPGRQFDIEGVAKDGQYFPLTITEEHYEQNGSAFPSGWYLFSPPVPSALKARLLQRAKDVLAACGVENGGFHVEMRVAANGEIYPIDYSNRMGYPELVSTCCGYSFLQLYVKTMTGDDWTPPQPKENSVYQRFIRNEEELANMKALLSARPEMSEDVRLGGGTVAGVPTLARVAVKAKTFEDMLAALKAHHLVPREWSAYYPERVRNES